MSGDAVKRDERILGRNPRRGFDRRTTVTLVRVGGSAAILGWALLTPGFLSKLSLFAMLNAVSYVGCVAVGMCFITISGNIMSLALGATVSVTSVVFMASLGAGTALSAVFALAFGGAITAAQGLLVGYFRANAILISIAALTLILGTADYLTEGQRIYPGEDGLALFRSRFWGVPFESLVFLAVAIIGQGVLSLTRVGREIRMTGSNRRAAETAGVNVPLAVLIAYTLAGIMAATAGVLLAVRYRSGDMDLGNGYEYRAIAAVLVGGTAIQGGAGSVLQTCIGVVVVATIEMVLRLRGYSEQMEYLVSGLVVLCVIMLQSAGERR